MPSFHIVERDRVPGGTVIVALSRALPEAVARGLADALNALHPDAALDTFPASTLWRYEVVEWSRRA